ncbi:MAG TPA: homoserine dehydrogenase [Polyangiaceae bacterium]|nr:homoserine dehydrogenase [Polyangiaceae bacterium]
MGDSKRVVKIALLGCGTVGGGVIRLLKENAAHLATQVGAPIEVKRVLVRQGNKQRVPECDPSWLTTDANAVFDDPEIDLFVEVMGGEEPAKTYIERALSLKKGVVSANKMLLARHGTALLAKARSVGVDLAFEASVGGGIPIIRTLREGLTGERVLSIHGILNGTCNYILTRMKAEGAPFGDVLKDAQRLGYAEAEPSLDVDGHDATQKLVVLSMLAFGAQIDDKKVHVEGIREIDELDFLFADRFGFTIKHLAIGIERGEKLELRAHPAMVPRSSVMANIHDVLNGVFIRGAALGPCLLMGPGAGALPTAVSVLADIVDVARSSREGSPGLSTRAIQPKPRELVSMTEVVSRYYLRFDVKDEPGVLAHIATALSQQGVSVEQMVQQGRGAAGAAVPVVIITHHCREGAVYEALAQVKQANFLRVPPRLIRIEDV